MFYTRIPVPKSTGYSEENFSKATRYFPLIGIIVGSISAMVFYALQFVLPKEIAILFSMAASIYVTGAFHEDGFADFCDGFGGGYTKEKILSIMKDSRIGTYGAVALVLMLAIKFFSIRYINTAMIPIILVNAHAFSRIFPVLMIYTCPYSRTDALSKTKPVGKRGNMASLFLAVFTGLLLFPFLHPVVIVLALLICSFVFLILRTYILKRIDGYTGDVLGALQQLCEIGFYLAYLIFVGVALV